MMSSNVKKFKAKLIVVLEVIRCMRWQFLELPDIAAVAIFNNPPILLQLTIGGTS